VKLDSNENIIWQKTLGGSDDDRAYSIQQTKDGGYVVAGYSSSNDGDVKSENQAYCWIVKLDQNGNIIWQNKIGDLIYGQSIKQTTDGGYVIVGDSPTNDFGIVKIDSNGNVSWQKSFGGKSRGAAYSVQQTTDGGYVVAGYTYSNDISFTNNQGSADYWIVKLDASGNMIWQKTFGGADSEHAYNIQQTADGGYIVAGETWSADGNDFHRIINYWIIKLDINGNIIWQKTLGGSGYDEAYSIKQTRDGGYIIAGYTGSNELSGFDTGYVYLIVKLDAKGNLVWRKTLGGSSNDFAQSIQQTKDGNYIIAGYTDSRDGDVTGNHGNFDYWIVKLNDVEDACSPVTPTVTVVATPNTNVYEGTKVSFTATVTNGGTLPVYQWKKNGITVGTNSKTYTDSVLKTGDSVYCVLTSNASCITTTSVKSNMLKMTVRASVTPTVSIAVSPGTTACKGSKVTFTATATNGGTSPVYQWKKNGANVGTNSSTYVC
jgi:arginine repressor